VRSPSLLHIEQGSPWDGYRESGSWSFSSSGLAVKLCDQHPCQVQGYLLVRGVPFA
jgi:hypothetical protein